MAHHARAESFGGGLVMVLAAALLIPGLTCNLWLSFILVGVAFVGLVFFNALEHKGK